MDIYNITNKDPERFKYEVAFNESTLTMLPLRFWQFGGIEVFRDAFILTPTEQAPAFIVTEKFQTYIDLMKLRIRNVGEESATFTIKSIDDNREILRIEVLPNMQERYLQECMPMSERILVQIDGVGSKVIIDKLDFYGPSDNAVIKIGSKGVREVRLGNSKSIRSFEIIDNSEYLAAATGKKPYELINVLISLDDGATYERITNSVFARLKRCNRDVILRIETSCLIPKKCECIKFIGDAAGYKHRSGQELDISRSKINFEAQGGTIAVAIKSDASWTTQSLVYEIYGFKVEFAETLKDKDDFYYDVNSRALDEETFKEVVRSNAIELSEFVEDNKAWPVMYYPARTIKNIDSLTAYELKSITDAKELRVLFPNAKTLTQLSFDQFGLKYDEITNIHIVKTTFERIFGPNTRPENVDIVYIPFIDQFFEINNVDDVKTNLNSITYYDCTLKVLTNRENVVKNDDILDIDDLVNPLSPEIEEHAPNAEHVPGPDEISTVNTTELFEAQTFQKMSMHAGKYIDTSKFNDWYGIAYIDTDFGNRYNLGSGWYRIQSINRIISVQNLKGKELATFEIEFDDRLILPFCKYIEVGETLSDFDRNQFYSSPVLPNDIKPLNLVWLVEETF